MSSLHERLAEARRTLLEAGLSPTSAGLDAEVLARHVLGWDRAHLLTHGREAAPDGFLPHFQALVARRAAREPVALILGRREFWGRDFEVTPDVLIPRPETEFIVEEVLSHSRSGHPIRSIVDVGTGSGCLAVTLAAELPRARVIATDVSVAALQVARRNAERHSVADRVRFVGADLLAGLRGAPDVVVSNPPYVPLTAAPGLQPEVRNFEPSQALFGGRDGLALIRQLLGAAAAHLRPEGLLVVEFGDGQESEVCDIARETGWQVAGIRNDLQGIARVALLRR